MVLDYFHIIWEKIILDVKVELESEDSLLYK